MSDNTIAMHTARPLNISVGGTVASNKINNKTAKWPNFVKRLQDVRRTDETFVEYQSMTKDQAAKIKDVGYFVGGHFRDGKRNNHNIISRDIITLDADHCPPKFLDIVKKSIGSYTYALHSTHGHCEEEPRLRLIFPLTKSIPPDQYAPIARMLASKIGIEYFDNTTDQPARAMFWPSIPSDSEYVFEHNEGEWVDPDDILDGYVDWKDIAEWPRAERHDVQIYEKKDKAQDPREKTGLIGAFCRVYDVHSAISEFISDAYKESGRDRYTYTGSTMSNGAVVYDGGLFLFSNHESDPCSGLNVNAFDLVRLHKFGELDKDCKKNTPNNKLKSYKAMLNFIEQDHDTRVEFNRKLIEGFDCDEDDEEDLSWLAELSRTQEGKIKSSLLNVELIVKNDPAIKAIYFNKLKHTFVKKADLPWSTCEDTVNGDEWTDFDDTSLRQFIEKKYGFSVSKDNAIDAILLNRDVKGFHPIHSYLEELKWDGIERLDTLLIEHLGVKDSKYTRAVSRKFMCAAVARTFNPGCKFDYCLILEGSQGKGKSTFVKTLVGDGNWFGDDIPHLSGKEVIESIQGRWVIELSELQSFSKSEIEHIKAFMSRTEDRARMAYGRRVQSYKRQTVFVGTTNDSEYLKDDTGNRRFWPVKCEIDLVDFDKLAVERDQIWAEAVVRYRKGEKLYFDDPEIENLAKTEQAERHSEDEWIGLISDWLERPIVDGFDTDSGEEFRNRVCAMQIYIECLGGKKERHTRAISNRITRAMDKVVGWYNPKKTMSIPGYGKPKGWVRESKM